MKLVELAEKLGCELRGDGSVEITGVAAIEDAAQGDISFLANARYHSFLETTRASALTLATNEDWDKLPSLRSADPYLLFAQVVDILCPTEEAEGGVSPQAAVDDSATVATGAAIGPFSVVSAGATIGANSRIDPQVFIGANVTLGADCHLYPGVKVLDDCVIGDRVTIHAGTIVGADGFGYASGPAGHKKIRQVGAVVIEDDVEIGANCTIDRAALGSTVIGAGTKIDNLVQIAHNVRIGKNCIIVSQVGISGSSKLGDWVTLAGQVGIVGHLKLGDKVTVAAQSGVTKDIPDGQTVFGSPALDISQARRMEAALRRLPEMAKRLTALEKQIKEKTEE